MQMQSEWKKQQEQQKVKEMKLCCTFPRRFYFERRIGEMRSQEASASQNMVNTRRKKRKKRRKRRKRRRKKRI
jgi:hypothetical protein